MLQPKQIIPISLEDESSFYFASIPCLGGSFIVCFSFVHLDFLLTFQASFSEKTLYILSSELATIQIISFDENEGKSDVASVQSFAWNIQTGQVIIIFFSNFENFVLIILVCRLFRS